jgi:hypothetical protein
MPTGCIDIGAVFVIMRQTERRLWMVTEEMARLIWPDVDDATRRQLAGLCERYHVDPIVRPFAVLTMRRRRAGEWVDVPTVVPCLSFHRVMAARTRSFLGHTEPEWGPEETREYTVQSRTSDGRVLQKAVTVTFPRWCRVTARRLVSGHVAEFTVEERWLEAVVTTADGTPTPMWVRRPYGQLLKCTIAAALRAAFPETTAEERTADELGEAVDVVDDELVDMRTGEVIVEAPLGGGESRGTRESAGTASGSEPERVAPRKAGRRNLPLEYAKRTELDLATKHGMDAVVEVRCAVFGADVEPSEDTPRDLLLRYSAEINKRLREEV